MADGDGRRYRASSSSATRQIATAICRLRPDQPKADRSHAGAENGARPKGTGLSVTNGVSSGVEAGDVAGHEEGAVEGEGLRPQFGERRGRLVDATPRQARSGSECLKGGAFYL